jgi:hypothetical protein
LPNNSYLIGKSKKASAHAKAAQAAKILFDDGEWIVAQYKPGVEETLAELGFELKLMNETPKVFVDSETSDEIEELASRLTVNSKVKEMMGKITSKEVVSYIAFLSGETPVSLDSGSYTIKTRLTDSGTPVENAIKYVAKELNKTGKLSVKTVLWQKTAYDSWEETQKVFKCSNIVAELTGSKKPNEIIILIAHLDSINEDDPSEPAPGADDNASGSAALLTIAKYMSNYKFDRTIRFVFSTGEEQGLLGSQRYVQSLSSKEKIVAVMNLDMIAYNTQSPLPVHRVKTRNKKVDPKGYKADMPIANMFKSVVSAYKLNTYIQTVFTHDGEPDGDQDSFWTKGYPAIWVIEDDYNDYNEDNMHTGNDKLSTITNHNYCTAITKATLGTAAHLANPR